MNKWIEDDLYKKIIDNTVLSCLDVLVTCEDKYLVIKRGKNPAKGEFWFPGSRIKKNEKMVDCVIRTCQEEVGLFVTPIRILGVQETIFDNSDFEGVATHSVNTVYLAKTDSLRVHLDVNHLEYLWIPISKAPSFLPNCIRESVEQAFLKI